MDIEFRERLLPGPGWIIITIGLVAMISIAYGAALGWAVGVVVAVGVGGLAAFGLWRGSVLVNIDSRGIDAQGAHLPAGCVGAVRAVEGEELATIRRGQDPDIGVRAFHIAPAWAPKSAVVVFVADANDPHACWLIATRKPDRVTAALERLSAGTD